ncbi:type II secretion system protein [Planctomicrobium sp. SH527]|uniref:type II secretion system protein n=1 Tax=Planctomicrobium sp. SH527 TaxID=3448123 RepID=UPI003F5C27E0
MHAISRKLLSQLRVLVPVVSLACGVAQLDAADPSPKGLPEGFSVTKPEIPPELVGSMKTLNEKLSKDLRPEENAAVLMLQAFGPNTFEPELKRDTYELMGVKDLPDNSPLFVTLGEFALTLDGVKPENAHGTALDIQAEMFAAAEHLWTAKQFPRVAEYLEANKEMLEVITKASHKPRYYVPLLSIEQPPRLLSAALNVERRFQYISKMLAARALLNAQQGNIDACIQDFMTGHRLAWLLIDGSPLDVSVAKAHVVDAIICHAECRLIESGTLTKPQLEAFAKALSELPPLHSADRAIDIGERAIVHQEIELLSTDLISVSGFFELPGQETLPPSEIPDLSTLKWDLALSRADEIWDLIVKALATKDRTEQDKLFAELNTQYEKWTESDDADPRKFTALLKADPVAASRLIGENMAMSLRPLWWQRRLTDERARVRRDLVLIGTALAMYRQDNSKYPASLSELSPKYLKSIPLDAHSGQPFEYESKSNGETWVMSNGPNLKNDANSPYSDDNAIRFK